MADSQDQHVGGEGSGRRTIADSQSPERFVSALQANWKENVNIA